ncbi:hypothetical protein K443DRAFT_597682 [Laccaria amethystina LaAM-08-1]|uniref:Uncharacterized protein n=1 Tax=Laccaria amethystina LaAM-08-1 TaxID=1095629 RepID=A0A0C9XGI2_9AGAR|nr:hypothetical protein K443DRAFT_597682 [Laccaria amethystina LaAM-08-1]
MHTRALEAHDVNSDSIVLRSNLNPAGARGWKVEEATSARNDRHKVPHCRMIFRSTNGSIKLVQLRHPPCEM